MFQNRPNILDVNDVRRLLIITIFSVRSRRDACPNTGPEEDLLFTGMDETTQGVITHATRIIDFEF
jgi:hypothetical protein